MSLVNNLKKWKKEAKIRQYELEQEPKKLRLSSQKLQQQHLFPNLQQKEIEHQRKKFSFKNATEQNVERNKGFWINCSIHQHDGFVMPPANFQEMHFTVPTKFINKSKDNFQVFLSSLKNKKATSLVKKLSFSLTWHPKCEAELSPIEGD